MESLKDALKETDIAEIHEKVEILSTDDEKIKLIGSLLSNDASRNILKLLFEQEMTANDIAKKTGMLLSLVIFHLQKMQEAGIVTISKIGKNSKGHDMKYYGTTKLAVIILPSKFSEKAKKSKSLFNSLRKIYKFTAIGIMAILSWFVLNTGVKPVSPGLASNTPDVAPIGIVIPLMIVIIGLIVERVIVELRK